MHEIPLEMLWDRETVDDEFADDEQLYCRIGPDHFIEERDRKPEIDIAAFELPDQSVNRSKDGGKPDMVRHNVYRDCNGKCDGRHHSWGVVSLQVSRIQSRIQDVVEGVKFETRVHHSPIKFNRFHSEIRAFDSDGTHIAKSQMERLGWKAHTRWRMRMRHCSTIVLRPNEQA